MTQETQETYETYESGLTRPDLPVPLSPLTGISLLVRRRLLGLRGPSFAGAHRVTVFAALVACALAVVGLVARPPWQWAVLYLSALIGLYVIVRALATMAFETRQRSFEPAWLTAQSEVLQRHAFEVLRFTVQDLSGQTKPARVSYDLSRPDDLREVLRRQDGERSSAQPAKATVEFAYQGGDGVLAVGQVHRALPDITIGMGPARAGQTWVTFPQAQYVAGYEDSKHPARRTYWALSGPVQIAVPEPAPDKPAREPAYDGAAGLASAAGSAESASVR